MLTNQRRISDAVPHPHTDRIVDLAVVVPVTLVTGVVMVEVTRMIVTTDLHHPVTMQVIDTMEAVVNTMTTLLASTVMLPVMTDTAVDVKIVGVDIMTVTVAVVDMNPEAVNLQVELLLLPMIVHLVQLLILWLETVVATEDTTIVRTDIEDRSLNTFNNKFESSSIPKKFLTTSHQKTIDISHS